MKNYIYLAIFSIFVFCGCGFSPAVVDGGSLYVPRGTSWQALRDSLHGMVGDPGKVRGTSEMPRPGHYKLTEGMSYKEIGRMLERGWETPVRVTFNNQPTLAQLAGRVAQQLAADSTEMAAVLLSDSVAMSYGLDSRTFIAMFLPDTYEFYWTATPADFVEKMNVHWEKFWASRDAKRQAMNLTRAEVSTIASIVYEETKAVVEMPAVAGVYVNRLRIGMPLQADPTVKFAMGKPGLKRILRVHLDFDSPYNTYKYYGLPPGPISMPSVAAIDAVLDYEEHNYLYFAARADFSGRHNFASTLAEHNRNADEYRRALDAAGIK